MTVLELRFPAGRFHATPWGRHVNEGAVEWPPAPWRLLRAIIATWYLKAQGDVSEETMRGLIDALAARSPSYQLPPAGQGHTRHYLPFNEGKNEKTTKVFDTFIQIAPSEAVLVAWDVELAAEPLAALQLLAHRLGYFGRAESLVEARVLAAGAPFTPNAEPLADDAELPADRELVRLLAPLPPETYANWRRDFMAKAEAALGPKPTAAQKKKLPTVPAELFTALHADTGDLQAAGWNLPPGAAYVNYTRQEKAFAPTARARRLRGGPNPTVARYAVTSTVPPLLTRAIAVGDQLHKLLCSHGNGHPIFTGKADPERPMKGHRHAHIFSECADRRGRITHVTIYAPDGFDEDATLALRKLQWSYGFKGHELRLVLLGLGQRDDFPDCMLFGSSKVWRSATPFVSTRHQKTFHDGRPKSDETGWQPGSAKHDLHRLLALEGRGAGVEIEQESTLLAGKRELRCLQFQTIRHDGGGKRGNGDAGAFTITFKEDVTGPLALGYGAHFGLGLFVPADA